MEIKKEGWKKIGIVGVDSGQLLLTDPCYIDSQWEEEEFEDNTDYIFVFPDGKEEKVKHCSDRWFELIERANKGELKLREEKHPHSEHTFSYNACCQETMSKGFGQLLYKMGHEGVGVVFNSGIGDGTYPVYAFFKNIGNDENPDFRIAEVRIITIKDENEDETKNFLTDYLNDIKNKTNLKHINFDSDYVKQLEKCIENLGEKLREEKHPHSEHTFVKKRWHDYVKQLEKCIENLEKCIENLGEN